MGSRRLTQRMSVLLPEPEGPQTTTTSPGATSSVTSFSTWSGPNHLLTCLYRIAGVEAAGHGLLDHQEDVARVHGLAGLDADFLHRSP